MRLRDLLAFCSQSWEMWWQIGCTIATCMATYEYFNILTFINSPQSSQPLLVLQSGTLKTLRKVFGFMSASMNVWTWFEIECISVTRGQLWLVEWVYNSKVSNHRCRNLTKCCQILEFNYVFIPQKRNIIIRDIHLIVMMYHCVQFSTLYICEWCNIQNLNPFETYHWLLIDICLVYLSRSRENFKAVGNSKCRRNWGKIKPEKTLISCKNYVVEFNFGLLLSKYVIEIGTHWFYCIVELSVLVG